MMAGSARTTVSAALMYCRGNGNESTSGEGAFIAGIVPG